MEELIKAMSDEDLAGLKVKYADNPSVATLIEGILQTRTKEAEQVKAKLDFEKGIAKLLAKLPHPDDVHNIYVRWAEVDVPDGEPEPVDVPQPDGTTISERRQPSHKDFQWVVEVNHAIRVVSSTPSNTPQANKRAITVFKRVGLNNELVGNFQNYASACRHLNLACAGSLGGTDSGERVLTRRGYVYDSYEGTDYTS